MMSITKPTTLLIMAAGIGSRFGTGIKQLEPVGLHDEIIITDNFTGINDFSYRVRRSLYYWLNRRSQKRSYTWKAFTMMLKEYPLAPPRLYVNIYDR